MILVNFTKIIHTGVHHAFVSCYSFMKRHNISCTDQLLITLTKHILRTVHDAFFSCYFTVTFSLCLTVMTLY